MIPTRQLLIDILLKKARGYPYKEKTDEYAVIDGKKRLVRSKTVTKRVLPDVNAVRALMTLDIEDDVTKLTDEQLQVEKLRLLKMLQTASEPTTEPDGIPDND